MDDKIILAQINSKIAKNPVTINLKRRNLNMHYIFDYELENLGAANLQASVNLGLFGIVFGAAASLWVTVFTAAFADPSTANLFTVAAIALSILSLYFAVRCYLDLRRARQQLASIKEGKEDAASFVQQ